MVYDIDTQNKSFLETAQKLREHGVKNNKFMLLLYDKDLSGVDPFSQTLTSEQKAKIFCEVSTNYWYFLREVCMVPTPGSQTGTHFQLNIGNCAASYCNLHNINNILILPRQIGKTISEVAFSLWSSCFGTTYSKESYLHKNQDGSNSNLARVKEMKLLMPKWLLDFINDPNDKDNITLKYFARSHNEIQAMASASNDTAAEKIGRGSSTPIVYCDEFAFLERNDKIFNALIPAWYRSAMIARSNHAPYGIRVTTTPNSLNLPQAIYCYNYIQGACKFTYKVYDIPVNELDDYIKKNSSNDFMFIQYTWQELGLSREWYEDQLRSMNNNLLNAKRELDCIWPESSEGNVFTESQLDGIKQYVKPVMFVLNINGYDISFFEKPQFDLNYIISCDVASGSSLDRSVMLIIHPADFRVVGLFFNARIDTESFKKLIYDTATKYFFHAVINIENNSYGKNILDALMKDISIEPRLYREKVKRQAEKTLSNGTVIKESRQRIVYGTTTNKSSRTEMYSLLMNIVDEEPEVFVSQEFYDEVRNLARNKNGKIEARQGLHDDIVMAYLVTRYALVFGKCFQEIFHINMLPSPSNARTEGGSSKMLNAFNNILTMADSIDNGEFNDSTMTKIMNDQRLKDIKMGYESPDNLDKDTYLMNLFSDWNTNN